VHDDHDFEESLELQGPLNVFDKYPVYAAVLASAEQILCFSFQKLLLNGFVAVCQLERPDVNIH
jgi:hypothetical protein